MIYEIRDKNRILTLIPSTPLFREMAAVLSVRTGHPLISDCTEIWREKCPEEGSEKDGSNCVIYVRKPSLDGKNFSRYGLEPNTSYVLLLKTADAADSLLETIGDEGTIAREIPDEEGYETLLNPLSLPRDEVAVTDVEVSSSRGVHVKDAELIFSGGRGIMNRESFDALRELAEKYGASVGASRPMVDQGWASWEEQIGQTGSIVKPKVYIAFGISGAVQHITGIEKSQNIIAVNLNKSAPIFKYANYGAYADDNSIIRNMLNIINKN